MADPFGIITPSDLQGFSQRVEASDPYGIIGKSLNAWQPDYSQMNATESGLSSFGKAFLSGLAQNYAQNRAAEQLNSVVSILPQLSADPYNTPMPQGVDAGSFGLLRGGAVLNKQILDANSAAQRGADLKDLIKAIAPEAIKTGAISMDQVLGAAKTGNLDQLTSGQQPDPLKNPNSPQYKLSQDQQKSLDELRDKFNKLPEVQSFSQVQRAASAMAGALKDKGAPSDLELTRYAILMIEPGMAVREGEQQAVLKSSSIPDQWKGELNKSLENGTALSDTVRAGLKRLASRAYEAQKMGYEKALTYHQGLAEGRGLLGDGQSISYLGDAPSVESIFGENPTVPPQMSAIDAELARRGLDSNGNPISRDSVIEGARRWGY